MDTLKLKYIFSGVLLLALIGVGFLFSKTSKTPTKISTVSTTETIKERDWTKEADALPVTQEAKQEFVAGNYEKSYTLYKGAASSTDDVNMRSSLEVSAAGALMKVDAGKAAEYYIEIANNSAYPKVSRGFALLQLGQFYKGTRDTRIIQAYAKSKDFINKPIEEIEYSLYQDIYALYPYGIAAASLARYELKKTPTKDIAQKVYTMYASGIDTNIESMKKYEGMRIIVPNTYMAKAALYRDLYAYQTVTKEDVIKAYEDAHREIKVQNNKISEQFNLLSYTEFLLSVGEKAKAEELIAAIDGGGVTDMVKKNLSNVKGSKTDYKNIATFFSSKERSQKFADFFIQFGW